MSYLVFARKYRPQRFEDVVAQDHVTRTLQNAVRNDRIGSGYLFCGPRGTGKTTAARLLAKALNCEKGPTPTPCGECSNCIEIAAGTSMDVLEIDAASNTGVDDVRTLRENVRYLPAGGKKRVYIIDEVHRLSGAAFDALLKTLEEPPPHVMFIFATTEPTRVPDTVLSRTQRFDFKRVSAADLAGHLRNIALREGMEVTDAALQLIARKADGSVRDSLSLMDQVAAFSGEKVTEEEVVLALGLVDRRFLMDFTDALIRHDRKAALELVRQVVEGGVDTSDFVAELLEHFRLLLLLASDREGGQRLDLSSEELEQYSRQAGGFAVGDIVRLMKIAADLKTDLRRSGLDERLLVELAAVRMAELESTVRLEDILRHLDSGSGPGAAATSILTSEKKKTDAPGRKLSLSKAAPTPAAAPPVPSAAPPTDVAQVRSSWPDLVKRLRARNAMLASNLAMAEPRECDGSGIVAAFGPSGSVARQILEKPAHRELVQQCLREHYGTELSIRFMIDSEEKMGTLPGDARDRVRIEPRQLLEKSPRIKMLVEKVDGEILGVRRRK